MDENSLRVTKWITPNESIISGKWGVVSGTTWCYHEAEDMTERTGYKCEVHIREKDGKLAIYKDI